MNIDDTIFSWNMDFLSSSDSGTPLRLYLQLKISRPTIQPTF
jgi:hypothetical protein